MIYDIIDINIICRSDLKMELVDLLNARKELTGDICERECVPSGKYRLSVHIWIINDNGEILIQQRSSNLKMFPNMWSNTGGASLAGEKSLETVLRELKEELSIIPNIDNLELIASYQRKDDYADVWVLRENFDISNLKLQAEEVQDVKWVTVEDISEMIKKEEFIKSSYDFFINYLTGDF